MSSIKEFQLKGTILPKNGLAPCGAEKEGTVLRAVRANEMRMDESEWLMILCPCARPAAESGPFLGAPNRLGAAKPFANLADCASHLNPPDQR